MELESKNIIDKKHYCILKSAGIFADIVEGLTGLAEVILEIEKDKQFDNRPCTCGPSQSCNKCKQ